MDLSALIFLVLAVVWAGYLIPRALRHHDEVESARGVEEFSDSIRVLDRRSAAVATAPAPVAQAQSAPVVARPVSAGAARRAAQRRRRVLGLLMLLTGVVATLAVLQTVPWWSVLAPGFLVVCWLIASISLAKRERSRRPVRRTQPVVAETEAVVEPVSVPAVVEPEPSAEDALWDPLPLTLPTYVTKPAARRTVRTIELTRGQEQPAVEEPAATAAPATVETVAEESTGEELGEHRQAV